MTIVEFECGCIGLKDFNTEETVILRDCGHQTEDIVFYIPWNGHDRRPSKDLPMPEQKLWYMRIAKLIDDGKKLRKIRELFREL